MLLCPESPRFLAKQDNWDRASKVLSTVRNLPAEHPYVQAELHEMQAQLEEERASVHGTGFWAIQKECWLIPGNRNRALLSIGLMVCQQMTGVCILTFCSIFGLLFPCPTRPQLTHVPIDKRFELLRSHNLYEPRHHR